MNFTIMAVSPASVFLTMLAIISGVLMAAFVIYAEFEDSKTTPKTK